MSEQNMRQLTQAAVCQNDEINLSLMVPRIKQIKKSSKFKGKMNALAIFNPRELSLKRNQQSLWRQ
ncbi:MAG: hypothetical protein AAF490_14170 [Chloroflexota bacterium]